MSLYFEATPIGLTSLEGFGYDPKRPARHCRLCGASFQPALARAAEYEANEEIKLAVEILLQEWTVNHNKRHTPKEHRNFRMSGRFLTPEAAEKLIPLGIYPVQDIVMDDEVRHAAAIAPRKPTDDVEGS